MSERVDPVLGDPGETRDRLEAIRKRAEEATPGPWAWDRSGVWTMNEDGIGGPVLDAHDRTKKPHNGIGTVGDSYPRGINSPDESMEFIAHAREDIPWLLGEVSRLRERLERETPEWTPLSAAMQKLYEVWDVSEMPNATTEDLIFAAEDACEAWKAYRQARFGNAGSVPSVEGSPE